MKSHARIALVLASIASTFAATSAHAGSSSGGGGGGIINTGSYGIDVIGTGKGFNKTWTLIDFQAKPLFAQDLQSLNDSFTALSNTKISDALGLPVDVGTIPFQANVDADASLSATAGAYVNQPLSRVIGGSSMGIRALVAATAKFSTYVSVPTYQDTPVKLDLSPSASAEVSYVRPASGLCRVGSGCIPTPAYYHQNVTINDPSGHQLYMVDQRQADPVVIPRHVIPAIPTVPSLAPISVGGGVTITPSPSVDAVFVVIGGINPTGASLDLSMGLNVAAQLTVSLSESALNETASMTATTKASLIDGHNTFTNASGAAETGATAHATAYLNAGYSLSDGTRLCYGASSGADISGILAYSYSLDASASGLLKTQKHISDASSKGQSYTPSLPPIETCIQL